MASKGEKRKAEGVLEGQLLRRRSSLPDISQDITEPESEKNRKAHVYTTRVIDEIIEILIDSLNPFIKETINTAVYTAITTAIEKINEAVLNPILEAHARQ